MRNIWTIARREYKLFFISPIAYAVAFMIFLIIGIIFYANVIASSMQQYAPDIQIIIGPMVTLFLFTTPAITMRALSDEQRNGTLELLLTAPVRDWEVLVGKWLGSFMFVLTIIVVTMIYPLILNQLVKPGIDQGMLISGYLGLLLLTAAIIAIGVAVSTLFSNQIASFFASLGILLVLWMISYPAQATGNTSSILMYFDLSEHFYNSFMAGIIELKDVVYYISVTVLSLFLGTVALETRRWR